MQKLVFIFLVMASCNSSITTHGLRLILEKENIESIALKCGNELYLLGLEESNFLVDKINSAEERGLVKGWSVSVYLSV